MKESGFLEGRSRARAILSGWLLVVVCVFAGSARESAAQASAAPDPRTPPQTAQAPAAKPAQVTKIDQTQFADILKPKGKPLLINFWATWCGPCRVEFPDLVKIDADYKGKIDFITVTLDFEEELTTGVPKFLADMKASMPTYLLVTPDETTAIGMVANDWAGALPYTILYAPDGKAAFGHQGIVKPDHLRAEIDKLLSVEKAQSLPKP